VDEEIKEELLKGLEGAANFMRGMSFDPALSSEVVKALSDKAREIDSLVEKHLD